MVVQPAGRSLTCWLAIEYSSRTLDLHYSLGHASVAFLVLIWDGKGHGIALDLRVRSLGQFNWEASHSPVLPTSV